MDNYKFLLTDKQSVFLLCCKIDKRKNTSYLSNNCKYDVFYNYVKILNLMTLLFRALFALYNIKLYMITVRVKVHPGLTD